MNRIIATFIASLTLTAACAEEPVDELNEDVIFVGTEVDQNADAGPSVVDYGETDLRMEEGEGDYELNEAWIRDCNICVRTKTGATCTLMACDEIDDRAATATCENDTRAQGEAWADDCNVCQCSAFGTVCTAKACEDTLGDFTDAPKQESCGARSCQDDR